MKSWVWVPAVLLAAAIFFALPMACGDDDDDDDDDDSERAAECVRATEFYADCVEYERFMGHAAEEETVCSSDQTDCHLECFREDMTCPNAVDCLSDCLPEEEIPFLACVDDICKYMASGQCDGVVPDEFRDQCDEQFLEPASGACNDPAGYRECVCTCLDSPNCSEFETFCRQPCLRNNC
ncbi:hypothetical protein KDL45_04255 [bacterium]|nr:hypothetical protein [bacterium]